MSPETLQRARIKIAAARSGGVTTRPVGTKPVGAISGRVGKMCGHLAEGWKARIRQAIELVKVISSPQVSETVYHDRMVSCDVCEHCTITENDLHWCACCPCPPWSFGGEGSDLEHKNKHSAHECPRPEPAFGAV